MKGLANVLKKATAEEGQMEFHAQNNHQNSTETPPNTHLDELSWVGEYRWGQQNRSRVADQFFTEGDVFENELIGKSSESLEQALPNERGLIAINDP